MLKKVVFVILGLLISSLTGCRMQAQDPTAIEQIQQMEAGGQTQVFQVTTATYLLDTAGFHAIDERINEEGRIEPGDAGTVRRVRRVVAVTDWPPGLEAKADQLVGVLDQYAEALSNDDVEAAKSLASEAHEVQHDLSHAVEAWLNVLAYQAEQGAMEHMHAHDAAHLDHSPHHGGVVSMFRDLHLEFVSEQPGEYRVYLTDAYRRPISPEGVSGTLVLMPETDHEVALPLQVVDGEYLAASGGPTDGMPMDAKIMLDGIPEGHVELQFTPGAEHEHEHE